MTPKDTMTIFDLCSALAGALVNGADPKQPLFIDDGDEYYTIDGLIQDEGSKTYQLAMSRYCPDPEQDEAVRLATEIITQCEKALDRTLSAGERRDLLKDNTDWDSELCDKIADLVPGAHVHDWQEVNSEPPYDICISCGVHRR